LSIFRTASGPSRGGTGARRSNSASIISLLDSTDFSSPWAWAPARAQEVREGRAKYDAAGLHIDVLAEGRKVAIGTKPTTRKTALMEVLHDRIEAAPGLMLSGMKATSVDWFEFDAVLDPRHPQYDGPREKVPADLQRKAR
jgi:hypothetical protein